MTRLKNLKLGRLGLLMEEANITAVDLHKATGLNMACISKHRYDLQDYKGETLIILATYFNTTSDYLLGLTDRR